MMMTEQQDKLIEELCDEHGSVPVFAILGQMLYTESDAVTRDVASEWIRRTMKELDR